MREIEKVLDDKEKVFWEGAPKFGPFVLGGSILFIFFGLIWMVFLIPFTFAMGSAIFLLPHFWIGLVLIIGVPLYLFLVHSRTYYAITNKRVLIQTGVIGRDFKMVDFDQITNAEVNVGLFDKVFGGNSGTILISTAGTFISGKHGPVAAPYNLSNIENPYEVFKFFKKVSHAVKTDVHYPNKYRPKSNPGYNTEVDPKGI